MIWTDGHTDHNGTNITERYLKAITKLTTIQHKGHAQDRDTTTRVKKGKKQLTKYELNNYI